LVATRAGDETALAIVDALRAVALEAPEDASRRGSPLAGARARDATVSSRPRRGPGMDAPVRRAREGVGANGVGSVCQDKCLFVGTRTHFSRRDGDRGDVRRARRFFDATSASSAMDLVSDAVRREPVRGRRDPPRWR
jgi:hypothetical protein